MLARVQSLLLAPHVALAEAGVPVDSILDESVLSRLGVRAALAYLRIAVDPDHVSGADLSRGAPTARAAGCRSGPRSGSTGAARSATCAGPRPASTT